jgi:cellulose synthase/poly-beta-1,6-N-acetylglucosamine synthase-like glycosyltransferase
MIQNKNLTNEIFELIINNKIQIRDVLFLYGYQLIIVLLYTIIMIKIILQFLKYIGVIE